MELTRELLQRIVALAAALILIFSSGSVYASIGDSGSGDSQQTSSQANDNAKKKCKKKDEGKKKCKKKDKDSDSGEPSDEEPDEETPEGGFAAGRVVEITYTGSAIGSADTPAIYPTGPLFPVNFIPAGGEVLATIEIVDDASPNASAGFSYDSDGDGLNDTGFSVCGSTPEPVEVIPGTQYNIFPYLLPSTGCTDGVATSGTIIVTFNKV